MVSGIVLAAALCLAVVPTVLPAYVGETKIVCYYDSTSYFREGQGKFDVNFLDPALQFCTHLIYRSAGINADSFKLVPLNENFDVTKDNYRKITELKRRFPTVRILLSVGNGDDDQNTEKYLTLLESVEHRLAFVKSAQTLVKSFGFDGIDLAWQFPTNKPKKIRGKISSFFNNLKKKIVGSTKVDEKEEEHKEQFGALVREVKNVFKQDGLIVSVTNIPNVNASIYMDVRTIIQNADFVNLMAFDYYTPKRNPKEADYSAPLYSLIDRKSDENGNALVKYWLDNGAINNKLVFGIPTYGRAWKMTEDSAISGVPPFEIDGPAEAGPYTKHDGLYSYPEVCAKLANPNNLKVSQGKHLRKVGDPSKRYGTYAFRLPDESGENGVWVSYEDIDTVGNKATYVRDKGLGGIAVFDITFDDFRGLCSGDKYPILRSAKLKL
ncbi:PREDICTED: chitinase-like protein Idgf4 isoform X2 [Nicrophorus vespilloides]|uniref:Chitinase-like protein Idgf4 isoform X2 n=1 Tax=Nicrophorus vespilloides TaxID=110193 RepID=A0ABM1ND67_NICVS|nr:PREDICTED: chitinase-like protein Idgf4 isoform X2 [Nicrophorus vespilloides]